jgi:hypothetical protein
MWVTGGCTADNGPRLVDEQASSCDDPYAGFDRLERVEDGWGLSTGLKPPIDGNSAQAGLVVSDLDGDGDLDVLLGREGEHPDPGPYRGFPRVFANEGGIFHEVLQPTREHEFNHGPASGFFAIDLDGDRLPEVLRFGEGWFDWLPNRGNLEWGERHVVHATPLDGGISVGPRINAMSAGDLDGDGDLELLAMALQVTGHAGATQPGDNQVELAEAHPHLLYGNEDGTFVLWEELDPYDEGSYAQLAVFTDRDSDGDQDLFLLSEFGGIPGAAPSAFWRNDGLGSDGRPILVNDAEAMHADLWIGGMGIDSADLNGDGLLDYCVVQFGPHSCLMSDPEGPYADAATAIGLQLPPGPNPTAGPPSWSGYSLELIDLDLDGDLDAVMSAANPALEATDTHVDRIYEQIDGQFIDRSEELGFSDPERHYGLVAADLNGDGAPEVLISTKGADPVLWANRCAPGAWLEVDLMGPHNNREGYGAQVRLLAGGQWQLEELYNLRTLGQGPARLHFGLGEVDLVDRVEVLWPGGHIDVFEDLPVRQRVELAYGG